MLPLSNHIAEPLAVMHEPTALTASCAFSIDFCSLERGTSHSTVRVRVRVRVRVGVRVRVRVKG